MKKLTLILTIITIISMATLVLADTIQNTNVHVKAFNNTLDVTNPDYSGNNKNVSLNITNNTIALQEFDFTIFFIKNETVDKSMVDKYTDCISAKGTCETEKTQFNMGWNVCKQSLDACNALNQSSTKDQLSSCNLDKQRIQSDLDSKAKDLMTCNEDQKSKGNEKFIWAIGGGILVFVGTMFLSGKWGNQNKDKSPEEFNPQRGY